MPEELMSMEAPVDSGMDTAPVDTAPDVDLGTETPETTPEVAEEPRPAGDLPKFDGKTVVDGKLAPAVKPIIEKLRAENPAVAKALQQALFIEDRVRRELPGGFKELSAIKQTLEQYGGPEGIGEVHQELDGWRQFDEQYTSGDPKLLEFMTETPEAQGAFLKMAPMAFEKFRELNPDGYASYVSQTFYADMQQAGVPMLLWQLGQLAGDNPQIKEIISGLSGYVDRIKGFASKPVVSAAPPTKNGEDPERAKFQQERTEFQRTQYREQSAKIHRTLYDTAWSSQIGNRTLTPSQKATIQELYGLKLQAIVKAAPKFNETLDRYFSANQRDGFAKYVESVYREAVPRALRTAIQQAGIGGKPGPQAGNGKPVAKGPAKPAAGKPASGYTFVNAKPDKSQIDNLRTSTDMWLAGKAILKDGKAVQWQR